MALRPLWQNIRGSFIAGVLIIVPLAATIWVLVTLVVFLESAILLVPAGWRPEFNGRPVPGLGILLAISAVFLLGLLTRSYVGRRFISAYEYILARLPIISSVYQGIKQLLESLFSGSKGNFRKVVLIEWPRRGVYVLAFHTGESFVSKGDRRMVNLFLPTTPNPTSGFYVIVAEEDMEVLGISVEQAFKMIMSAGIVSPDLHVTVPIAPQRSMLEGDALRSSGS